MFELVLWTKINKDWHLFSEMLQFIWRVKIIMQYNMNTKGNSLVLNNNIYKKLKYINTKKIEK